MIERSLIALDTGLVRDMRSLQIREQIFTPVDAIDAPVSYSSRFEP
jgi:hypothetical protein